MTLIELKYIQSQYETVHTNNEAKCVEQIHSETGQVLRIYPSVTAAAKFMKISQSNISSCCNGKKQTCCGFKWRFYDGPLLDCKYRQYSIILYRNKIIFVFVSCNNIVLITAMFI